MSTIFEERWLSQKPLASNNLAFGLRRQTRSKALGMRWVETSPSVLKNIMVFDLDFDEAAWKVKTLAYDDQSIPEPNWITTNPGSGHAHVGYVLDAPVSTPKGLEFFKGVYEGLRGPLGGDTAYSGRITRNPLLQPSEWLSERLWRLEELETFTVSRGVPKMGQVGRVVGGRNDELFEALRAWSYRAFVRLRFNAETLKGELLAYALELNASSFKTPLPQKEVEQIVKSIHTWTVRKFSAKKFSEIQSKRAKRRWETSAPGREENIKLILFLKSEGYSFNEISTKISLPTGSVKTLYYRNKGE